MTFVPALAAEVRAARVAIALLTRGEGLRRAGGPKKTSSESASAIAISQTPCEATSAAVVATGPAPSNSCSSNHFPTVPRVIPVSKSPSKYVTSVRDTGREGGTSRGGNSGKARGRDDALTPSSESLESMDVSRAGATAGPSARRSARGRGGAMGHNCELLEANSAALANRASIVSTSLSPPSRAAKTLSKAAGAIVGTSVADDTPATPARAVRSALPSISRILTRSHVGEPADAAPARAGPHARDVLA